MKKLLFIPMAFFTLMVSAQTTIQLKQVSPALTLAPNATVNVYTYPSDNHKVIFDIKNTSTSTQTYNATRYDVLLNKSSVDTAKAYFCFAGTCYGPDVFESPTPLVLLAGKSASELTGEYNMLVADLDEATVEGSSIVKYTFQNANNANDSIQITVKYSGAPDVGISKTNKDVSAYDIFPNPASDGAFLKVLAVKAFDSKLTIYNSLGAVVSEKQAYINEGKNKIDLGVENFSAGIYFVNIKTNDASVTKRLILK